MGHTETDLPSLLPQTNGRADLAVKAAKRILADNTDGSGYLNQARTDRALLPHRNTPIYDLDMSSPTMFYGRPIKDYHPLLRDWCLVRPQ